VAGGAGMIFWILLAIFLVLIGMAPLAILVLGAGAILWILSDATKDGWGAARIIGSGFAAEWRAAKKAGTMRAFWVRWALTLLLTIVLCSGVWALMRWWLT